MENLDWQDIVPPNHNPLDLAKINLMGVVKQYTVATKNNLDVKIDSAIKVLVDKLIEKISLLEDWESLSSENKNNLKEKLLQYFTYNSNNIEFSADKIMEAIKDKDANINEIPNRSIAKTLKEHEKKLLERAQSQKIEVIKNLVKSDSQINLSEEATIEMSTQIKKHLSKNIDIDTASFLDALRSNCNFFNSDTGSINKLLSLHQNQTAQKVAKLKKIEKIKEKFTKYLDYREHYNDDYHGVGVVDNLIVADFDPNDLYKSFVVLDDYIKEECIMADVQVTLLAIEKKYNVELIPKQNLYEALFTTSSGNYYLARLFNQSHLENESARMDHCVGDGSHYVDQIKEKKLEILSLRATSNNSPVVTIEYDLSMNEIRQIKLEGDEPIRETDDCFKDLVEALKQMQETFIYDEDGRKVQKRTIKKIDDYELRNIKVENEKVMTDSGVLSISKVDLEHDFILKIGELKEKELSDEDLCALINIKQKTRYDLSMMKTNPSEVNEETRIFRGNLGFKYFECLNNRTSPLYITGHVEMEDCDIENLPNNLVIQGDAVFTSNKKLKKISDNSIFMGSTYFDKCPSLIEVAKGCEFYGFTTFEGNENLERVLENTTFSVSDYSEDTIFTNCVKLKTFGEGVLFGGTIVYDNCPKLKLLNLSKHQNYEYIH